MKRKGLFLSLGISTILFATISSYLVNVNLQKTYRFGDYVKEQDAYFVETIDDPAGYVRAQKFVAPSDGEYSKQQSRFIGSNQIGNIESVWDTYTGKGTTIAIIDDGFDYEHPEYIRSDGTSAILSTSRYYYQSGSSVYYQEFSTKPSSIGEDWEDTEWASHGTATSTTAAAPMNNGGGVGVAPEANILALKVDFTFAAIKASIQYAINQNVDVINMSLGAYGENFTDPFGDYQEGDSTVANYLEAVSKQAYNAGVIVVAAAGNEATYRKSYPASNYKVIGVGALGNYYDKGNVSKLAEFTNYVSPSQSGDVNVDILAPGYVYTAHKMGTYSKPTHTYADTQGTSFSSPIIAGAAALWKEKYPDGTPDDFLTQLQNSADGKGTYTNKMIPVSGWDSDLRDVGPSNITNGRLNVANLLDINEPSVTVAQASFNIAVGETRQLTILSSVGTLTYSSANTNIATVTPNGLVQGSAPGTTNIVVTATKNGKIASVTIPVTVNPIVAVSSMDFDPSEVTLNIGDTYDAEATLILDPINASRIFLFDSSNPDVATVHEDLGLVTAVGPGTTTIEVISINGDGYAELEVTVQNVSTTVSNGTLLFGNGSGRLDVSSSLVTGKDDRQNTWTITTIGTESFTKNTLYSQIGSSKSPASSIEFKMELSSQVTFTHVSATFGGFSNSKAVVTIKVGNTVIGTGSVGSNIDTTTLNSSNAKGTTLTISLTNIAKGIKAYDIAYTYTSGPIAPPTLTSVNVTNSKTYHPGEAITKNDISVNLNYSDGSVIPTSNFTFASEGYRFTYEDTRSGNTLNVKSFSVTYNNQDYSFSVNVVRNPYVAPSGATTTLSSSHFNDSNVSKSSSTLSSSTVQIGGIDFNISTNAYIFTENNTQYLSFGKGIGSIQNKNMLSGDLTSLSITQKSGARQDGVLSISKNGTTWVAYSVNEIAKGGYRYFKYAYTTDKSNMSGASNYSNIQAISFTTVGVDTPVNVANYIMFEDVSNQCEVKLNLAIEKLNTLSGDAKTTFWNSTDYVIATARERLEAWARHEGKTLEFSNGVYQVSSVNYGSFNSLNGVTSNAFLVFGLIALLSSLSIASYIVMKKKRA